MGNATGGVELASLETGAHFLNLAVQKGLTSEACNDLIQTGMLADLFEAAVSGTLRRVNRGEFRESLGLSQTRKYIVTVNYSLSLEQMISLGRYDWVDFKNITAERFPVSGDGKREHELELLHFTYPVHTDYVKMTMALRGLEPASTEDLLAFGARYPNAQKKSEIIGLGSVADIPEFGRCALKLAWNGTQRALVTHPCGHHYKWWPNWRFLARRIRK